MDHQTTNSIKKKESSANKNSPSNIFRESELCKISDKRASQPVRSNMPHQDELPILNLKETMMDQTDESNDFLNKDVSLSKFNYTDADICRMLKFNSKRIDKKHLEHKKNLLENLFKINYNSTLSASTDEEDTTPMLSTKGRMSPYGSPCRANTIIKEAKNSLKKRNKSYNSISFSDKKGYKYPSLEDYSTIVPKYDRSPAKKNSGYYKEDEYGTDFRSMKSVKYDPREDRTINIRKKLSRKKFVLKEIIKNKPAKKTNKNETMRKNYKQMLNTADPTEIFEKIRLRKKEQRYLEAMNNGIFGRFSNRNIQNQVRSQPEENSHDSFGGPSHSFTIANR
ncbi:unnamed protein product [Moneuplotes crassus]|uniref:Uncharacterized protein n=1 Tax=Euplotes crassus TaxID=5936 RepID=A0AAD1XDC5_EUPCR|nr:unnamed protein product [Moneuplotes crassus]